MCKESIWSSCIYRIYKREHGIDAFQNDWQINTLHFRNGSGGEWGHWNYHYIMIHFWIYTECVYQANCGFWPWENKQWEIVLVSGSLQYRNNRNLSSPFCWGRLTHGSLFILFTLDSSVKLKTHCLTVVTVRMLNKLSYYVSENLRNFTCSKVRLFLPS